MLGKSLMNNRNLGFDKINYIYIKVYEYVLHRLTGRSYPCNRWTPEMRGGFIKRTTV